MFKFVTRIFRKKAPAASPAPEYTLPSDDPDTNPIIVEDDGVEPVMHEVAALNSRLLAPVDPLDPAGMSARTRAVVEIKSGLNDLGSHIRMLGQRMHAQSMGQARLIEALSNLPATLRDVIPNTEEQTRALAAMKLALDEQAEANRNFVEAMKPLPAFVEAAANLPETARKQMWAINELTKQLEEGNRDAKAQGEQVKVMVETIAASQSASGEQVREAVGELTKLQKAQLKQAELAVKSAELARRSAQQHHLQVERSQQSRMTAIARDQTRHFNRIEEHFRKTARTQFVLTGVAVVLAVAALAFAGLVMGGVVKLPASQQPATTVQHDSPKVDPDAVVSK